LYILLKQFMGLSNFSSNNPILLIQWQLILLA
jgi:hypothetical protein